MDTWRYRRGRELDLALTVQGGIVGVRVLRSLPGATDVWRRLISTFKEILDG